MIDYFRLGLVRLDSNPATRGVGTDVPCGFEGRGHVPCVGRAYTHFFLGRGHDESLPARAMAMRA